MTHVIDTPELYSVITSLAETDPLMKAIDEISRTGRLYVSAISHGEILGELPRIADRAAREQATSNYSNFIAHIGRSNILPFDTAVARIWGKLCNAVRPDTEGATAEMLMVAATARANNFRLVCTKQAWHDLSRDIIFEYV